MRTGRPCKPGSKFTCGSASAAPSQPPANRAWRSAYVMFASRSFSCEESFQPLVGCGLGSHQQRIPHSAAGRLLQLPEQRCTPPLRSRTRKRPVPRRGAAPGASTGSSPASWTLASTLALCVGATTVLQRLPCPWTSSNLPAAHECPLARWTCRLQEAFGKLSCRDPPSLTYLPPAGQLGK